MTAAVKVNDLSRSFGRITALDSVTFEVAPGAVFGLLGPNGAGKTTLFSITANFLRADQGGVEVLGIDVRQTRRLRGRMTILPQDARFQRSVPILDQLVFFLQLIGRNRHQAEQEVRRTLDRVGLADYARRGVHSLSHGMVKRLGLAQAFLGEPEVILLDEPTSGLDPKNARQIRDLILELNQARTTVVVSSHNMAEIQELCDHVAILDHGKLVTAGSVEEIKRAGSELMVRLDRELTDAESGVIGGLGGVKTLQRRAERRYTISLGSVASEAGSDQVIAAILRALLDFGATPRELREGNTLEAHFLDVTAEKEG